MATVIAVCRSAQKGTSKQNIHRGVFRENYGLIDDAHSDAAWHRQVSLLALESIRKMDAMGLTLKPGDFAENITTEGLDLVSLPLGTRLAVGKEVILEVTQIGKECHTGCAVFKQVGRCIMPREGIFARVIRGGTVQEGDGIQITKAVDSP